MQPVDWIGSSLKDLKKFPEEVRHMAGYRLQFAQQGLKHESAEPFDKRLGAQVLKIAIDVRRDTYRVIYTPALAGTVP